MRTKKFEITVCDLKDDRSGYNTYTETREYPNDDDRHCDLCIICQSPIYPKCMELCTMAPPIPESRD